MQSGPARAAVFAACCDCVNLLTMSGVLVSAQVKPGIRPKQWSSEPAHELASQEGPARTRGSHCGTAQARGWVVVTSGAYPSALVAWLGFDWREERFELLDLLLQLDHLELTPDGQPLELLQLSQPLQLPGLLLGNLPLRLHLVGHVPGGGEHAEDLPAGVAVHRGVVPNLGQRLVPVLE